MADQTIAHKPSTWFSIFSLLVSLGSLGFVLWSDWSFQQLQSPGPNPTTKIDCHTVAFTIPRYDAMLVRKRYFGDTIEVTLQSDALLNQATKFASDLAKCNSDFVVVTPLKGYIGFANIQVGYHQGVGAYIEVPDGQTFRLFFRDEASHIAPISKIIESTQRSVVLN